MSGLAGVFPHADVGLLELVPHESIPTLRSDNADLIITTADFAELPLGPDLDIVPLATDPIVLVDSPDHPAPRGPTDLADEQRALDMPQSHMANLTLRPCRVGVHTAGGMPP